MGALTMIAEGLEWLDSHLNPADLGEDGYSRLFGRAVHRPAPPPVDPQPTFLGVATLESLIAYLQSDIDHLNLERHVLHVASATRVQLLGPIEGYHKQRATLAVANFASQMGDLLDRDLSLERANIALQSLFVDTVACRELRDVLSSVTGNDTVVRSDDGTSQSVEVKVGVSLKDRKAIPNPVDLAPFRSFPECEPVSSPFIVRTGKAGDQVTVRLIPADGNAWELEARRRIAQHLGESLKEKNLEFPLIMA